MRLQKRHDLLDDRRRRRQVHRLGRHRRHIRFPGVHFEQVQMHVPEGRPQRQRQRERKPRLLLPGQRNRRPEGPVVELLGLRPRNHAPARFTQQRIHFSGAHPVLSLGAAHGRGFLAFRNLFQAVHRLLAQGILPLGHQRLVAHGFNVPQVFGLGQVGKPGRPQLLDFFVVAVVVRRPQQGTAQSAARHAGEVSGRRLDFGLFDRKKLVEMVVQDMGFRIGPLAEHPFAFQALEQRLPGLPLRRWRQFQFDQVQVLPAQKPVGDFDQGKSPATGLNVADHQRQAFAVRQKGDPDVEPRQRLARRAAVFPAGPMFPARAAPVIVAAGFCKAVAPLAARWTAIRPASALSVPEATFAPRPAAVGPIAAAGKTAPLVPAAGSAPVSPGAGFFPAGIGVLGRLARPSRYEIQIQRKFRFFLLPVLRTGLVVHAHVHSIAGFPPGGKPL